MEKAVLPLFEHIGSTKFHGSDYDPAIDDGRLSGQIGRVYEVMKDGKWRTLDELQFAIADRFRVHDPHASLSAQLRHLRRPRWGNHTIEKRRRDTDSGLFEYRLVS